MKELEKILNYEDEEVGRVVKDGEGWFVGKDVCNVVNDWNEKVGVSGVEEEEVSKV